MKIEELPLSKSEIEFLDFALRDGAFPSLAGLWSAIDAAWEDCQCDPNVVDERIAKFYTHPVWLLNGLFIEQDAQSLSHRRAFADYIVGLAPERVAEVGGGFGTLARMIGSMNERTQVHVVDPYAHPLAVATAASTPNVRFVPELEGWYDVLIATDLFEHVLDPLALVEDTAAHLRVGGEYLMGNCFWPVIQCHLRSTFHFRWSWNAAMVALNLQPCGSVRYAHCYRRVGPLNASAARDVEDRSRRWFRIIEHTPSRLWGHAARFLLS